MQIIGMDILLEGRGRAKSALILFKRLRVREMGGTSNGPKIRNKIMYQSISAVPIPPPGISRAFAHVLIPGVGHLKCYHCPGVGHLPTPGTTPGI